MSITITSEMLDKLEYDTEGVTNKCVSSIGTVPQVLKPTALVVFANSDVNAAVYHLVKSIEVPFCEDAIASVFVQESIRKDFIVKLQSQLKSYPAEIVENERFKDACHNIRCLKLDAIVATDSALGTSPTIVCDATHEHFGVDNSGVVTLHTFRTAKGAIALITNESIVFVNISIWNENFAGAYELVTALRDCSRFFVNCYRTPFAPIQSYIDSNKCFVTIDKSYHYETMQHDGVQKSVVFPIGTIFAN